MIRIIFRLMRANRQSCHGTKVRRKSVHRVGRVAYGVLLAVTFTEPLSGAGAAAPDRGERSAGESGPGMAVTPG